MSLTQREASKLKMSFTNPSSLVTNSKFLTIGNRKLKRKIFLRPMKFDICYLSEDTIKEKKIMKTRQQFKY